MQQFTFHTIWLNGMKYSLVLNWNVWQEQPSCPHPEWIQESSHHFGPLFRMCPLSHLSPFRHFGHFCSTRSPNYLCRMSFIHFCWCSVCNNTWYFLPSSSIPRQKVTMCDVAETTLKTFKLVLILPLKYCVFFEQKDRENLFIPHWTLSQLRGQKNRRGNWPVNN